MFHNAKKRRKSEQFAKCEDCKQLIELSAVALFWSNGLKTCRACWNRRQAEMFEDGNAANASISVSRQSRIREVKPDAGDGRVRRVKPRRQ